MQCNISCRKLYIPNILSNQNDRVLVSFEKHHSFHRKHSPETFTRFDIPSDISQCIIITIVIPLLSAPVHLAAHRTHHQLQSVSQISPSTQQNYEQNPGMKPTEQSPYRTRNRNSLFCRRNERKKLPTAHTRSNKTTTH